MKRIVVVAAIAFALVAVSVLPACQSAKNSTTSKMLSFNFEKGKGYDYEMIVSMDQEQGEQSMKMDMSNYYSMDVTAEEGDVKTITTTYERFKMNMQVGIVSIEVDSDKPLPSLGSLGKEGDLKKVNSVMGAIRGRKFQMKVNKEGRILELSGFENMASAIADSLGLEPGQKQEMMQEFTREFNNTKVRAQFERLLYVFPNKEVKVGDTWTKTFSQEGPFAGNYASTFTVKEIEGDMVTVSEDSKVTGNGEGMGLQGKSEGTMVIDSRTGLVVNADQDLNLSGTSGGNPVKIKTKSKIRGKAR